MGKKKRVARNEFRFNKNQKHVNYVFEDDGKKFSSLGITHSPKTFGKKNMPLRQNPQKGHSEQAYIRNEIVRDKKSFYSRSLKNYKFSAADFKSVKAKIRNFKRKRKK